MIQDSLIDIIKNGSVGFPLTKAYKNGHRFYTDFVEMINFFKNRLLSKDYRNLENKILSGCSYVDGQSYLQCMSELVVLYFVMRKLDKYESFKYEPKYNGGYNPECSFVYAGKTVNVEVKCPHMGKRMKIESHDTLKIAFAERMPNKLFYKSVIEDFHHIICLDLDNSEYSGIEIIPRMDNKLKDFLEHSQKKFPSGDDHFNILVIALEIPQDVDEWYGYLFGSNGAFTHNTYIKTNYDCVDAVLLCTPICGLKRWESYSDKNIWYLENTINLLLLDTRKCYEKSNSELSEKGKFYLEHGINMFGDMTSAFLSFQRELDEKNEKEYENLPFKDRYISFKVTEIKIFSEFMEWLDSKH